MELMGCCRAGALALGFALLGCAASKPSETADEVPSYGSAPSGSAASSEPAASASPEPDSEYVQELDFDNPPADSPASPPGSPIGSPVPRSTCPGIRESCGSWCCDYGARCSSGMPLYLDKCEPNVDCLMGHACHNGYDVWCCPQDLECLFDAQGPGCGSPACMSNETLCRAPFNPHDFWCCPTGTTCDPSGTAGQRCKPLW